MILSAAVHLLLALALQLPGQTGTVHGAIRSQDTGAALPGAAAGRFVMAAALPVLLTLGWFSAQNALGDLVFVEAPKVGRKLGAGLDRVAVGWLPLEQGASLTVLCGVLAVVTLVGILSAIVLPRLTGHVPAAIRFRIEARTDASDEELAFDSLRPVGGVPGETAGDSSKASTRRVVILDARGEGGRSRRAAENQAGCAAEGSDGRGSHFGGAAATAGAARQVGQAAARRLWDGLLLAELPAALQTMTGRSSLRISSILPSNWSSGILIAPSAWPAARWTPRSSRLPPNRTPGRRPTRRLAPSGSSNRTPALSCDACM